MIEYPRWVYGENGEAKIVMTHNEREKLLGKWHDTPTLRDNALAAAIDLGMKHLDNNLVFATKIDWKQEAEYSPLPSLDERGALLTLAKEKGIDVHHRTGIAKLKELVA